MRRIKKGFKPETEKYIYQIYYFTARLFFNYVYTVDVHLQQQICS